MKFLYPQFLWALLALAVPLIIHLFNFRRFTTLYFSDTRLLRNIVKQSRAINRLKHLLIMFLRMLALAMLVLAFANPYFPAEDQGSGERRYLHLYIDNSPSMTSGELQTSKLSEVRSRAAEFVKALPASYRVQVLSNDFTSRQLDLFAPAEAVQLVDEMSESHSSRDLTEIISRVQTSQKDNSIEAGELYIFSDFQTHAFAGDQEIPQNINLIPVLPSIKGPTANFAVDSLWFYEPVLQPGFDQLVKARISYTGNGEEREITLNLEIDGEVQGVQKLSMMPGTAAEAEFTIRTEKPAEYAGALRLDAGDDPAFDNALYFNFKVAEPFRILLTGSDANQASYNRLFSDSIYELEYSSESAIDYGSLPGYDLIIVDGAERLSSGFIAAVRQSLAEGKNLVVIPGNAENEGTNNLLAGLGKPSLGDRRKGATAASISWNDPHFSQVFSSTPENPALPVCRFFYAYNSASGYPLISLDNGMPLVTRLPAENGDIILFLSSLDSSGLKRQPLFVPLMLNAALFSRENQSLYTIAGRGKGPAFNAPGNRPVVAIELPEKQLIPRQRKKASLTELYELPSDIAPGTYPVVDGEEKIGLLSINTDPAESRWNFLTFDGKGTGITAGEAIELSADAGSMQELIKRRYEGVSLWKWFVAAALGLLILELLVLKIWK